jgi:hypothetical protein
MENFWQLSAATGTQAWDQHMAGWGDPGFEPGLGEEAFDLSLLPLPAPLSPAVSEHTLVDEDRGDGSIRTAVDAKSLAERFWNICKNVAYLYGVHAIFPERNDYNFNGILYDAVMLHNKYYPGQDVYSK